MVDSQKVSDCKKATVSLRRLMTRSERLLHSRSWIHRKQRNVVTSNWPNSQSWHKPGAVAGL